MDEVKDDFVHAAKMSNEAGFDLLELHFAHGYLLASFISPLTNTRIDTYGGSLENRMRFPLEVFDEVRSVWPDHKPMSVRISAVDWAPAGCSRQIPSRSPACSRPMTATSPTSPPVRPSPMRSRSTAANFRRRSRIGFAMRWYRHDAVGNISSYQDVNTILARVGLICVFWRAHICGIPTGRGTRRTSKAIRLPGPILRDAQQVQTEAHLMPVTYSSYLRLDELLSLQQPRPGELEHDETLFVIIHQVYELWFKEVLHELDYLQKLLRANDTPLAGATLKRILTILKTLVAQIDVLETITPLNFSHSVTGSNRAAVSVASVPRNRVCDGQEGSRFVRTIPEGSVSRDRVQVRFNQPTVWDAFLHYLAANEYRVPKTLLQRDYTKVYEPSPEVQRMLVTSTRRTHCRADRRAAGRSRRRIHGVAVSAREDGAADYWDEDGDRWFAGAEYLMTTLNQPAFPDLWAIRAEL